MKKVGWLYFEGQSFFLFFPLAFGFAIPTFRFHMILLSKKGGFFMIIRFAVHE